MIAPSPLGAKKNQECLEDSVLICTRIRWRRPCRYRALWAPKNTFNSNILGQIGLNWRINGAFLPHLVHGSLEDKRLDEALAGDKLLEQVCHFDVLGGGGTAAGKI
jgi:hypothetical protein